MPGKCPTCGRNDDLERKMRVTLDDLQVLACEIIHKGNILRRALGLGDLPLVSIGQKVIRGESSMKKSRPKRIRKSVPDDALSGHDTNKDLHGAGLQADIANYEELYGGMDRHVIDGGPTLDRP